MIDGANRGNGHRERGQSDFIPSAREAVQQFVKRPREEEASNKLVRYLRKVVLRRSIRAAYCTGHMN